MEKAALALGYGGVGRLAAHGTGVGHTSASCGHAAMVGARPGAWRPRRQTVEHVARAMEPNLESVFGIFRAYSDLGASIKVALLWMLYKLD